MLLLNLLNCLYTKKSCNFFQSYKNYLISLAKCDEKWPNYSSFVVNI